MKTQPVGQRVTDVRNVSEFVEKYYKKERIYGAGMTQSEMVRHLSDEYVVDGFVCISRYGSNTGCQVWADFN